MSTWLVVPVRSLRDGKRRLASALDESQRTALVEWLLVRTLERAAEFPGLERTLVVSACEEARMCAVARGARVVSDHGVGGLNDALRLAQSAIADVGGTQTLVVSSDLPALRSEDLRECAAAATETTIALAPDRRREGTNGICLPTSCRFEFSFGINSFVRHLDCVGRLGMHAAIVDRPGLAFDVDFPADLFELGDLASIVGHVATK